jgi:hypothetical protein
MTRFIYKGIYYPVIGNSNGWVNYNTTQIIEKRIGGWKNADKWWSFSIGIKCRLFNPKKPYFQFVIDAIDNHPEMEIRKEYFSYRGEELSEKEATDDDMFTYSVYNNDNKYIGNIRNAYFLTNYIHLQTAEPDHKVVSIGYLSEEQKWCGWSHRAKCCFGLGDRIFDPDYGDDTTPYVSHGDKEISSLDDMRQAAINFAKYVS